MDTLSFKTISANKNTVNKEWILIDAEGQTLGRLASTVAKLIRGKHKPSFTPHVDCGDKVVIINAEKIHLTGNKFEQKEYIWHTGYPGGQRFRGVKEELKKKPTSVLEKAIKGMLPKNRLSNKIFISNLFIYSGANHNQSAQQPRQINLEDIK